MSDDYAYWQDALAGKFGPVHDGDPQCGFWRMPKKGAAALPVAIWREGDGIVASVGYDGTPSSGDADRVWTWVCRYPVTEEAYRHVMAGGSWPDVAASVSVPSNSESVDPAEILRDQIEACRADLAKYAAITSDEQSAAAQSLRSRLLELHREADKTREAEKKPHFEAGKAVDAKWQPLVKSAKESADKIASAMSAWENEKDRKARADREAARRDIEEAARKAIDAGMAPPVAAVLMEAIQSIGAGEAVTPTKIKGGAGRAASVREKRVAVVTDYDKLYAAVRGNTEVRAVLQKVAQAIVDGGETVDGVTVETTKRVV